MWQGTHRNALNTAYPCLPVQYGKWPTDVYETHLTDYRNHVARSGREFGIPRNDQEFLDLYYYLRNRTEVRPGHRHHNIHADDQSCVSCLLLHAHTIYQLHEICITAYGIGAACRWLDT